MKNDSKVKKLIEKMYEIKADFGGIIVALVCILGSVLAILFFMADTLINYHYESSDNKNNKIEYSGEYFIASKTSYGKSIENTEFFKENGGLDASDYISIHSRKHMYDPDTVSTPKKTQYGKDVNVGKLCEDTIMKPDEVIYNKDQNVMIYKKEYPFNISTSDTPTGTHRVFIPLNTQGKKTIRMSQFPLVGGN